MGGEGGMGICAKCKRPPSPGMPPVLRLSAPSCSLVLALSAPGCSLLTLSTPPVLRLCAPSSSLVRGITRVAETASVPFPQGGALLLAPPPLPWCQDVCVVLTSKRGFFILVFALILSDKFWYHCVCVCMYMYMLSPFSLTLCDSMACSLPGSSVHGILQAKVLE